jgi:type VI secretion system protein ImpK
MEMVPSASTFLMQFFQEFYREVLIQREFAYKSVGKKVHSNPQIQEATSDKTDLDEVQETLVDNVNQDSHLVEEEELCDRIQGVFKGMFERFSLITQNQAGEFAGSHFQEALYSMVALLDEIFLAFSWDGKDRWEDNLMEKQIFHTQVAGELIFRKVEALIQANDPVRRDISVIYLMILALGFKGKFRGEDDEGRLHWYRQQLYIMANYKPVALFHPGRQHLIEECYDHIITLPALKILPNVRNWIFAFFCIIAVFTVVSTFLYYKSTRDLNNAIEQILTQAQKLGIS